MISDTSPDAERVQLELLRRAGMDGRLRMLVDLTDEAFDLSYESFTSRHRGLSPEDLRLRWLECCYGPELASAVRRFVQSR